MFWALLMCNYINAIDVLDVLPAAQDEPRVFMAIEQNGQLLTSPEGLYAVNAFLDTGASGFLASQELGEIIDIDLQVIDGANAVFTDVGIGGRAPFHVSEPVNLRLLNSHENNVGAPIEDFGTFGTARMMVGLEPQVNPLLPSLNVVGMPAMTGKVVVMDPRPVDDFESAMHTYIYDAGTPYDPSMDDSNPGIPRTSHQVQLSYGDFERFTSLTPAGAELPDLRSSPFIGASPFHSEPDATDNTPGITVAFEDAQSTGSFLLDTGAAVSYISEQMANELGLQYQLGTEDTLDPILETLDGDSVPDQFKLTVGGTGGERTFAGFYLDNMLVRTLQGDALDDEDPRHFNFDRAPVLVADITLDDSTTGESFTLDGIFGMNALMASMTFNLVEILGVQIPFPDELNQGNFDWIVFDEPNGTLGLTPKNLPGDTDGDGFWTCEDALDLTASELEDWLYTTASTPGDANLDGHVDALDLSIWEANKFTEETSWCSADFTHDGRTDVRDFHVWLDNRTESIAGAAVPEPTGLTVLAILGLLCPMLRRQRAECA